MNIEDSAPLIERPHGDQADRAQRFEEIERATAIYDATHRRYESPLIAEGERICLDCYEPITARRLRAAPQAVRCFDCQQRHEHCRPRGTP